MFLWYYIPLQNPAILEYKVTTGDEPWLLNLVVLQQQSGVCLIPIHLRPAILS